MPFLYLILKFNSFVILFHVGIKWSSPYPLSTEMVSIQYLLLPFIIFFVNLFQSISSTAPSLGWNGVEIDGGVHGGEWGKTMWNKISDKMARFMPSVRIRSRFNQGCVGGTKCQFFLTCWTAGGSIGSACGPLSTCCVFPSSQEIQPAYYGPVNNDPCE